MFALQNELALLEQELQRELAKLQDKDTRQKMRSLFHRTITMMELRLVELEDDKKRTEVHPLPAPQIAGLLPAKIPDRLPKQNEYRKAADAAAVARLNHKDEQAEKTRAHYRRNMHIAKREARRWGVDVEVFIEAMATGKGYDDLIRLSQNEGLYREMDCGGVAVVFPGQRVFVNP